MLSSVSQGSFELHPFEVVSSMGVEVWDHVDTQRKKPRGHHETHRTHDENRFSDVEKHEKHAAGPTLTNLRSGMSSLARSMAKEETVEIWRIWVDCSGLFA